MKINATEQTSTFPYPINDLPEALNKHLGYQWETQFGTFKLTENSIKWILSNVQVSMYNPNRSYVYNKAFYENCFKETVKKHNKNSLKLFQQIRDWAEKRKLYEIGDANTQYIKLQEECGELAKALLKNNQEEIIDAIGDIVVVLTNLAHQKNVSIEQCISSAYDEIKDRTGKMINGTFVKDE